MFFVWMHSSADLVRVTTKTDVFIPYVEVMYIIINDAIIHPDTLWILDLQINIVNKIIRSDSEYSEWLWDFKIWQGGCGVEGVCIKMYYCFMLGLH